MKERMRELLINYLRENNPDVLLQLEEAGMAEVWLQQRVNNINENLSEAENMDVFTEELRQSKFLFVKNIFETEFPADYQKMLNAGILTFEVINMLTACQDVFGQLPLTVETEEDSLLIATVTGAISEYLQSEEK